MLMAHARSGGMSLLALLDAVIWNDCKYVYVYIQKALGKPESAFYSAVGRGREVDREVGGTSGSLNETRCDPR